MKIKIFFIIILFLTLPTISATELDSKEYKKDNDFVKYQYMQTEKFELINYVNETLVFNYLKGLVDIGPRYTGTEGCEQAADYIFNEFKKMNLEVEKESWRYIRYKSQNVIATKNGTDNENDAVIVLCAHYDSITWTPGFNQSVGANDDGSGVAALLAIANVLSTQNLKYTVKFIAVSGEEVGTYGSHHYAKNAYKRNENIIAAFSLDTIGYANNSLNGQFISMMLPQRSKWLFDLAKNVTTEYSDYLDIEPKILPHSPADDQSFMEFGYDNCLIIQACPSYIIHTPQDTMENINFSYLVKATKFTLALAFELCNKKIDLQVRITSPDEGSIYAFNHKLFNLPGFNLRRLGLRGMTFILGSATTEINVTSDEEIMEVTFSIDGNYVGGFDKAPYNWKINGLYNKLYGRKTLGVRVTTITGKTTYDEMDIFIIKPNLLIWRPFPQKERLY